MSPKVTESGFPAPHHFRFINRTTSTVAKGALLPRCPGGVHTYLPSLRNVTATPQCPGVFIVVLIGPYGSRFWESHPSVKATSRRRTANETPAIAAQESSPVGDDDWQAANRYKVSVLRWESYPPFKALAAERWNIRPL